MRDNDFNSTDEQGKKAQRGDPVSDADQKRVRRRECRDWDGRDRTCDASFQLHRYGFRSLHEKHPARLRPIFLAMAAMLPRSVAQFRKNEDRVSALIGGAHVLRWKAFLIATLLCARQGTLTVGCFSRAGPEAQSP